MVSAAEFERLSQRLRGLTRDGSSIEAAQVKLIALDEIREAAGARWPRMRERVRTGSLGILSQHTGPDDVIVPAGDGFIIMLAESRPGDAQRRCQEMQGALPSFYLGEEPLASLRPEVTNRALTADGLTEFITTSIRGGSRFQAQAQKDEIAVAPILVTHEHRPGAILAAPVAPSERGRRIVYNHDFILDGRHHDDKDWLELDLALLDAALTRAASSQQKGRPAAIGACVHASTMQARRSRETYTQWLAEIDPELRRVIFVAIQEIARGTPLISIVEWVSALRPSVARVWLDFHYSDHAISNVGGSGAWAAGFHLPTFSRVQRDARAQHLREQIGFWSKSLHGQGLKLVVHGFQSAEFLEEAGALGVDLLTSDAHWPFAIAGADA
ncbi:MAG: hypothetical protein ACT4OF_07705 [Caulobacteraceae bacterium]